MAAVAGTSSQNQDSRRAVRVGTGPADSANHAADYRNTSGRILKGPEYFTIFDGETGGRWDLGTETLHFALYYDPLGDGSGNILVAEASGDTMPDNDWFTFNILQQRRL